MVSLRRNGTVGAHALAFAAGMGDQRFVAMLEFVIAPTAPHGHEFDRDRRDVAGRRMLALHLSAFDTD
jgi:hypothetical protein